MAREVTSEINLDDLPVFTQTPWQMSYGERVAIEGMLAMLKPRLALEVGRAEGGSLRRIAEHAGEVVSLDLVKPSLDIAALPNVTALSGDSHVLLGETLQRIGAEGRSVDFALVDGDHSADGAFRDVKDLLDSDATTTTVIVAHDTLNEDVRRGLEAVDYQKYDKVSFVDLDFVPGYVASMEERFGECWGGLGLIVVDSSGKFGSTRGSQPSHLVEHPALVWPTVRWIRAQGARAINELRDSELVSTNALHGTTRKASDATRELERLHGLVHEMETSASWRITKPLRYLKRRMS